MGHTDVVTVDPAKWTFPPFSATRDGGYVYGRGSLDDRPHLVAGLMTMLVLKRLNVPLDRDVIFLAEAGEEGTTRVGIDFMVKQHCRPDRRGVLLCGSWRNRESRREDSVRSHRDGREDTAPDRIDGSRNLRACLDSAGQTTRSSTWPVRLRRWAPGAPPFV